MRRWSQIQAPVLPANVVVQVEWDETREGWADVLLDWHLDHGIWPVADLEIWTARGATDWAWVLVVTLASTEISYRHSCVHDDETRVSYRMRYRWGWMVGPFTPEYPILITREQS